MKTNKNKFRKQITIVAFIILSLNINFIVKGQIENKDSFILNIEALYTGEQHTGAQVECMGNGKLYCPLNQKYEYQKVYIYQ